MRRRIIICGILFLLFVLLPVNVQADSLENFSTDKLSEYLEDDVREQMEETEPENITELIIDTIKSNLDRFIAPIRSLTVIVSVVVLSSFLASLDTDDRIVQLGGVLCVAAWVIPGISGLIETLAAVCKAVSVFLAGAVPVYAGLMIASGTTVAGTSYGSVTLVLANVISVLANHLLIPVLSILLGLGISGSFSSLRTSGIIESVYKPVRWLLTFAVSAFSGIISLQTFITSRADAAGIKTTKYIVSSAVPVVGSALGDGVEAVRQSLSLLRTGAGAFGVAAEILIIAPVFISGAGWFLTLSIGVILCEIFEAGKLKSFTESCLLIVKMILAAAVSVFVVSVVTAAVVVCAGG